jgi:hypothetical protein
VAKITAEQLQRLGKAQKAEDDDLDTDITKSRRMAKKSEDDRERKETAEERRKDTVKLLITIGIVVIIIAAFVILFLLRQPKKVVTVDEMHEANLKGELKPSQGYIYHGYSFINFSGVWYSRVQKGNMTYEITFNNDPKSVEGIPIEGKLSTNFLDGDTIYITFDPDAVGAKYITVANAGLSMSLIKGFGYKLVASCTDNQSTVCQKNGAVRCGDEGKPVIYFKESAETKILLNETCITVQGTGPEMVKAKDRLLMDWYGMMG